MEEARGGLKDLTGKPTGKSHLGRPGINERTILH